MFRTLVQLALVASISGFQVGPVLSGQPTAVRTTTPVAQFGTGNYDSAETKGFFLSPIPGEAAVRLFRRP